MTGTIAAVHRLSAENHLVLPHAAAAAGLSDTYRIVEKRQRLVQ